MVSTEKHDTPDLFSTRQVLYPLRYWTAVRREVFEGVCPQLTENRAAVVYLVFYDRAWRSEGRRISTTIADATRWTGLDGRTIHKCLVELASKAFVVRVRSGHVRSRTNKPVWRVPLAEFDFRKQGPWTPVPLFFLSDYCRAYSKAVLLPVILMLHLRVLMLLQDLIGFICHLKVQHLLQARHLLRAILVYILH